MPPLLQQILIKPSNELKIDRFVINENDLHLSPCTGKCKGGAGCMTSLPSES